MKKTNSLPALLATLALVIPAANASTVLYSSTFGGSSGTNLNGTAVTTSGATGAQHTQFGTSASAAWTAATNIKADGSFVFTGTTAANLANSSSGTLAFAPQNGYVYTVSMTTNLSVSTTLSNWFATGFFMQSNYAGKVNIANGATVWALTRPGNANINGDQVAHYNLAGGAGAQGAPSLSEDITAPTTLRITLDTTLGTGNWKATYYVGNDVLASVADLNAVDIEAVGIGVTFDGASTSPGSFQSFELSVIPEPSAALLGGLGLLALLRRRR